MAERYVITTPIYYVNSVPHIGTALTTIAADITARYQKLRGKTPFFLTGTDENGLKVKEAAEAQGRDPLEFVAEISNRFKDVFDGIAVEYDDFIRTTEDRHTRAVQALFQILQANGYVYEDKYEGWYDVSSETFFKESDLVDGKSPDGNPVRWVEEPSYYFKLSAFEKPLLEHIEKNPQFILPEARKNEVVSFIKQGLRDVSISRQNPGWGIPVPGDPGRVIYVWFDALINYVAAAGWPDAPDWQDRWPADVQWMGKDILTRFHATLWPAMLMGANLPLPKHLVGHAWLLMGGEKISKSRGNVIPPVEFAEEFAAKAGISKDLAVDALRYGACATFPFETDTTFTVEDFDRRYNSDLANDLGNALNRTLAMSHKFVGGIVPNAKPEPEAQANIDRALERYSTAMETFRIDHAVDAALDLVRFLNKYIDTRAPWALNKAKDPALGAVLRSMLLTLRTAEGLIQPIMPSTALAIAAQLGLKPISSWDQLGSPDSIPGGTALSLPQPMFPRLDLGFNPFKPEKKETQPKKDPKPMETPSAPTATPTDAPAATVSELISIEDFVKVKLRIGRIVEAAILEGSDKLMKLQVQVGEEKRQIVAGIQKSYTPEDLIGRQIVVCVNLKPAKLRGAESQGMLLAATDTDGSAILLMPDREAPEGAGVK
jgi:methionyl-tRNA synthetase